MKILVKLAVMLMCAQPLLAADGNPASQPATAFDPRKLTPTAITALLSSPNKSDQDNGLAEIEHAITAPAFKDERGRLIKPVDVDPMWVKALTQAGRYDQAESLAVRGIIRNPHDMGRVDFLQHVRVEAFIAKNDNQAALSAAHGYYDVCGFKSTSSAVDLICQCLSLARPDQKGLARKFRAQQVAAASATEPTSRPAIGDDNVLLTIDVNGGEFKKAADAITTRSFEGLFSKGNLLLLAGDAKSARQCFEDASEFSGNDRESSMATEGVARAIRADTGEIGAANAYILTQRAGGRG